MCKREKMEMEMRAMEDIEAGQDLTPPLPPLTFALHHPPTPSSDIRAALHLRLLHHFLPSTSPPPSRLFGLLTNHDRLMSSGDPDVVSTIRDGARAMAMEGEGGRNLSSDVTLEEALLCLVVTNAVEVQDNTGRMLGIAVYDTNFSWINHSCSPNACYRFSFSQLDTASFPNSIMRIVPAFFSDVQTQGESDICTTTTTNQLTQGVPRIIVRSIKKIKEGEAVTVAYTDLLQPKAMRQSELWLKYQFVCCCKRCTASPPAYVDRVLEEISASNLELNARLDYEFDRDEANQNFTDCIDEIIAEYLSVGDPESCCKKMENLLNQGLLCEQSETEEGKVVLNLRLQPLHHLALNAYTTLASAYKIRSSDLLALNSDIEAHNHEAFNMSRTSAAYSLLLAGATDHLFQSESSLIASAANFWVSAGESLLTIARSSGSKIFAKPGLPVSNSSLENYKCSKCSLIDKFEINNPPQNADFEHRSCKFLDCITNMTRKVWTYLSFGCAHLQTYKDPIDFSWLQKFSNLCDLQDDSSSIDEVSYFGSEGSMSRSEAQLYTEEVKVSIFQLGVHCLLYGGHLASLYYGENSHLTCQINNVLYSE